LDIAAPSGVAEVQITASAITNPAPLGFNSFSNSFFNFDQTTEIVNIPLGSLIEIYNGNVTASIGLT
jgi:hypothetical protein